MKRKIDILIDKYTPCNKCGNSFITRDYGHKDIVLYCAICGKRFYPTIEEIKEIFDEI